MTPGTTLQLLVPTKLTAPQPLSSWVLRERLLARLGDPPGPRLTLVVAPAGFGKSTLVAQWLLSVQGPQQRAVGEPGARPLERAVAPRPPFAWLTLDEHDHDGLQFLAYLAGSIACAAPGALTTTLDLLGAPQSPPLHVVLQALLVELSALPDGLTLVLDDYYMVAAEPVHQAVAYLLRNLPPRCGLVLLSRVDPPLPLARLRAERQLAEVRAADLRFTEAETDALLANLLGATPPEAQVAALHQQTEGWAIALQLAALAQLGSAAHEQGMAVAAHQIAEYLADEVLALQPGPVQQTLLALAVPERFCAGLAAALLGTPDDVLQAESLLEQLLRANLMLAPLDAEEHWFRFHHLFRDLLLRRLHLSVGRDGVRALHGRAAAWLAAEGLTEEALRHYLAAGDDDGAADLVERQLLMESGVNGSNARQSYWLRLVPAGLVARRPGLALIAAHLAAVNLDLPALEAGLARVDGLLGDPGAAGRPVPWATFRNDLAAVRGTLHCWAGRPDEASAHLRAALADGVMPALAVRSLILLGLVTVGEGRYAEGARLFAQGFPEYLPPSAGGYELNQYASLCGMRLLAGDFDALAQDAGPILELIESGQVGDTMVAYLTFCLGVGAYERSDLAAAAAYFGAVVQRKYRANYTPYMSGVIGLALIAAAQGDFAEAAGYARTAAATAGEIGGAFYQHQAFGCAIRVALARGDAVGALRAAASVGPDIHLGHSLWLETPLLSWAEALIAGASPIGLAQAERIVAGALAQVEPLNNLRLQVRALAVLALLRQAQGRPDAAQEALSRAVALAAPRRFLRTFLDLGPAILPPLRALATAGVAARYVRELLAAAEPRSAAEPAQAPLAPGPRLPELLTRRETEILTLLARRWSDKEIAEQLVIAPNTVRKHTSTIYQKLGVGDRREAAAAAHALGLLPAD